MAFAALRGGQNALRGGTDFQNPRPGVVQRVLQALAEVEIAAQEMIEYQLEVMFGLGRELKTEDHARGVYRQSSEPAACPSVARLRTRPGGGTATRASPHVPAPGRPSAAAASRRLAAEPRSGWRSAPPRPRLWQRRAASSVSEIEDFTATRDSLAPG